MTFILRGNTLSEKIAEAVHETNTMLIELCSLSLAVSVGLFSFSGNYQSIVEF